MAAPRKDEMADAAYSLYKEGLSLTGVADRFGVTRQSIYELFKRRGMALRSRPEPLPAIHFGGRKYTMRNHGYYGATDGDRGLLHRHIWEAEKGVIPAGWDIHHLDEDKTNNTIENFECLPKVEHTRLYSTRCNQFEHNCGRAGHADSR